VVTAGFRDPLLKGGEGPSGDRDEPEGGTLNNRSRVNGVPRRRITPYPLRYVWHLSGQERVEVEEYVTH